MAVTWYFEIDWNNDGDYSDANENITSYVISADWSLGMKQAFQLCGDETRLTMVLKNADKRFSPEYSSSPLYGNIVPQRRIRIRATVNAVTYVMWTGWIESIRPQPFINQDRTCTIIGVGAKQFLQQSRFSLTQLEAQRSDQIIVDILDDVLLPPDSVNFWLIGIEGRSEIGVTTYANSSTAAAVLDTGIQSFTYVGDTWDETTTAYEAIYDVIEAERGRFFFNRDGKAEFWNRHHLFNAATLDATISPTEVIESVYSYGENIANVITVNAYPKTLTNGVTIWTYAATGDDEGIQVRPDDTREFKARYKDPNNESAKIFALNAEIVSATSDNPVSYSLVNNGKDGKIIFNNTGAKKALVTAVTISGDAITTYDEIEVKQINGLSRSTYGAKPLNISAKMIETENLARSIAEYESNRRGDPRGEFRSITMIAKNDTLADKMISNTVGAYINYSDSQLAHDANYFLIGESHSWRVGDYRTTWYLELADTNQYWLIGEVGYSEIGQTTKLSL